MLPCTKPWVKALEGNHANQRTVPNSVACQGKPGTISVSLSFSVSFSAESSYFQSHSRMSGGVWLDKGCNCLSVSLPNLRSLHHFEIIWVIMKAILSPWTQADCLSRQLGQSWWAASQVKALELLEITHQENVSYGKKHVFNSSRSQGLGVVSYRFFEQRL